jgi:DAK2 domain fusion protein YloV
MVKIRYLDGRRFRRALLAGNEWLHQRREYLNRINVYPVADADTGTNMSLTMKSAAEGLKRTEGRAIGAATEELAQGAIMGSQGNSGAILAQFFQGLAEGLRGKLRISTRDFAAAVQRAREAAYRALSQPKEGTILTVIKDWSEYIVAKHEEKRDFADLLRGALERARQSLKGTTEQLEVLRQHGVVDAGAQGFIHLLEGITEYVDGGTLRSGGGQDQPEEEVHLRLDAFPGALAYRYCTEGIVRAADVDRDALESQLADLGDSLVVVSGSGLLKVHIHTNDPEALFGRLKGYGELLKRKAQDMQAQHDEAYQEVASVAVITDSACDLPADYLRSNRIGVVPLKVIFGDRVYLDKVTLAPADFLLECTLSSQVPRTSQPGVGDYLRAFEDAARWAKEIVVVSLSGGVSGTFEAAKTAAAQFHGVPVHVVDSACLSVGQGLLVQEARRLALAGESAQRIALKVEEAKRRVKLFIALKSLEFARRGGRVSLATSLVARMLNVKPVITLNAGGKVAKAGAAFGSRGVQRKVVALAAAEWKRHPPGAVAVAHVGAPELADWYRRQMEKVTGLREVPVLEAAAALAAHAGPGAAGVAILGGADGA